MDNIYTGREIAIFTDAHALLEPIIACLEDISRRGITEVYSLGDNIGVGPKPFEVLNSLEEYGVRSIAGNSEYYCSLGIEPFRSYFNDLKTRSQLWTLSKLSKQQLDDIKAYPSSLELEVGGKKVGLCHFANDVRIDYINNSTWSYQRNMERYGKGYEQFNYTNSQEQKDVVERMLKRYGDASFNKGYVSFKDDPLFSGRQVNDFDDIIQGHVHFKINEKCDTMKFWSIRAVGMAYGNDPIDTASYVILREKKFNMGFDLEEVLVKYDREKMEYSILSSDNPDVFTIGKFTNMGKGRR